MATRAEVQAQAAAQASAAAAAWAQFQAGWAALGLTGAAASTPAAATAVSELLGDVVAVWGEVAATLAADFYDDLRARAGLPDTYTALVPDPLNVAQVERLTKAKLLVDQPPELVPADPPPERLPFFEGPVQRLVRQAERTTVNDAAARDPRRARVARIPTGEKTCAFCLVMASRGYVYRSLASAGQTSALPLYENRFHDDCDCALDITWERQPVPPDGYDPGELYGRYDAARAAAGSGDLRKILRELRKADDTH